MCVVVGIFSSLPTSLEMKGGYLKNGKYSIVIKTNILLFKADKEIVVKTACAPLDITMRTTLDCNGLLRF